MVGHQGHGSLATEAALLLGVVADKLEPIVQAGRERADNPESPEAAQPENQHQNNQPCTSCPICVMITVVKSDNGEINHKLAEGALLMVNALRDMLADSAPSSAAGNRAADKATGSLDPNAPQSPPANPVQHIDIH